MYYAFDTKFESDKQFADQALAAFPFHPVPFRLQHANSILALVAATAATQTTRDAFISDMETWFPPLKGTELPGSTPGNEISFQTQPFQNLDIPGFSDVYEVFNSEAELENYIKSDAYADGKKVWAAIVFNEPLPNLDYTIRMNGTAVPTTNYGSVRTFERGVDLENIRNYVMAKADTSSSPFSKKYVDPFDLQPYGGFTTLQLLLDRWAINSPLPPANMNREALLSGFGISMSLSAINATQHPSAWQDELSALSTTPATYVAVAEAIRSYMVSESYAPQQVQFVAFPQSAYQTNDFYSIVLPMMSFFFVICLLFPVSRLIRGIVMEKETKIREGMKMMGMGDAPIFFSWIVTYTILYAILALIVALICAKNIFQYSGFGYIWLHFFLFGLSSASYCYLIATFFSKARTASTMGVVLFLAGYFPSFAVGEKGSSAGAKVGSSLLSPTAFALGINFIGTLEDYGVGVNESSIKTSVDNWTLAASYGMLVFDTILYAVLAWYIDAVLPASIREYGVPRPWYFPFTPSYWREVFGLPAKRRRPGTNATAGSYNLLCFRRTKLNERLSNGPRSDSSFFEEPDASLRAKAAAGKVVTVRGLRKEFDTPDGTKLAVDDVDLDLYEGQIFCLLGHNGAGKTTTISMLTGLIEATEGSMTVFGNDVGTDLVRVRKEIGVCPQHDVLWPELTVQEHLQIFAAIKGVPPEKVESEINKAVQEVGLTEKIEYKSSALSGGQKRKLSVCIALVGGSRFILLDEPTSGMDPYSRRSTWQILQNAREGRVMILTTHFMDEADILGDRICIMANGQVKCCGSSMFLKERFGVGYVLTLVKNPPGKGTPCDVMAVMNTIKSFVPEAAVATNVAAELGIRLPLHANAVFPDMLRRLDDCMDQLGIVSYGVSVSDVQDVFLKVAHGETVTHPPGQLENPMKYENPMLGNDGELRKTKSFSSLDDDPSHVVNMSPTSSAKGISAARAKSRGVQSGWKVFFRHFFALFMKRMQFAQRDFRGMCYQLLIPVVMTAGGLAILRSGFPTGFISHQFTTYDFNTQQDYFRPAKDSTGPMYPNYVPYFNFKSTGAPSASAKITNMFANFNPINATLTESEYIIDPAKALQLDADDPYGFISSTAYPTRDMERMSSFLLKDRLNIAASKYGAYVFTKDNTIVNTQGNNELMPDENVATYAVFHNTTAIHGGPIFMNLMNSAILKSKTASGSIVARTHPLPFTKRQGALISAIMTFSAAIIIVMAFAFIPAYEVIFVVKEREVSAKHQQLISGVSIPAYWLSTWVFDVATYLFPAAIAIALTRAFDIEDFYSTESRRAWSLCLLFLLYGTSVSGFTYCLSFIFKSHSTAQNVVLFINVTCMILMIASLIMSQVESTCRADQVLRFFYRLLPGYSLGNGLVSLSFLSLLPAMNANCDIRNGIAVSPDAFLPYDAFNLKATGWNIIYMFLLTPIYFCIAVLIDIGLSKPSLRTWMRKDPVVKDAPIQEDPAVAAEAARVDAVMARRKATGSRNASSSEDDDIVLLHKLRKVYGNKKVAVRELSYGVPLGQVFGFLGINGAGKTTTLEMCTGARLPTSGTAHMAGYDIITEQMDVRRLLGYCPQWDALLENLTTYEHLCLYARIKGIPESSVKSVVNSQLAQFDLTAFKNKKASSLSGGNKRKLSVAIALIGAPPPPVVFLDEPSTGMDPVAKRHMWRVLARIAESRTTSIILTTHSMEEVEALCNRIGIMVGGRLRALGTSQELKNSHGKGFFAEIRLRDADAPRIQAIVKQVQNSMGNPSPNVEFGALRQVCAHLGKASAAEEISENGTGWALYNAYVSSSIPSPTAPLAQKAVPIEEFAAWWAEEEGVSTLVNHLTENAFPGSEVVERQGALVRFRVPNQNGMKLYSMFARLEAAREPLNIATYSLSQATLESIFNDLAGQQDEEKNIARGIVRQE